MLYQVLQRGNVITRKCRPTASASLILLKFFSLFCKYIRTPNQFIIENIFFVKKQKDCWRVTYSRKLLFVFLDKPGCPESVVLRELLTKHEKGILSNTTFEIWAERNILIFTHVKFRVVVLIWHKCLKTTSFMLEFNFVTFLLLLYFYTFSWWLSRFFLSIFALFLQVQ